MGNQKNVLVIGHTAIDIRYDFDSFPTPGEYSTTNPPFTTLGGAARNISLYLAKLGMNPILLTKLGNDKEGIRFREQLESEGVFVKALKEERTTKIHVISSEEQRHFSHERGTAVFTKDDLTELLDFDYSKYSWVVLVGLPTTLAYAVAKKCRQDGSNIVYAPKIVDIEKEKEFHDRILEITKVFILNFEELPRYIQAYGKNMVLSLFAHGPKVVIVTLDPIGSWVRGSRIFMTTIEPKDVLVLDSIGRGDSYLAGFLKSYTADEDEEKAAKYGTACAAFKIGHKHDVLPRRTDIEKILPKVKIKDLLVKGTSIEESIRRI